jgi:hypothetical protein
MDMNLQKQMAFNEKLDKLLEETQKKPSNYDIIFTKNSEFKKQHTLLQVKFKASALNGQKRSRLMVGCCSKHFPKGYWEGSQEV